MTDLLKQLDAAAELGKKAAEMKLAVTGGRSICEAGLMEERFEQVSVSLDHAAIAAELRAKDAEIERLRRALQEIRTGKVQADNEHPLGEWFSMASRFMNIARAALTPAAGADHA